MVFEDNGERILEPLLKLLTQTEKVIYKINSHVINFSSKKSCQQSCCKKYFIRNEKFVEYKTNVNCLKKIVKESIALKVFSDDLTGRAEFTASQISLKNHCNGIYENKLKLCHDINSFLKEANKIILISCDPQTFVNQMLIFLDLIRDILISICTLKKPDTDVEILSGIIVADVYSLLDKYTSIWNELKRIIGDPDNEEIPIIHNSKCKRSKLLLPLFSELKENISISLNEICKVKLYYNDFIIFMKGFEFKKNHPKYLVENESSSSTTTQNILLKRIDEHTGTGSNLRFREYDLSNHDYQKSNLKKNVNTKESTNFHFNEFVNLKLHNNQLIDIDKNIEIMEGKHKKYNPLSNQYNYLDEYNDCKHDLDCDNFLVKPVRTHGLDVINEKEENSYLDSVNKITNNIEVRKTDLNPISAIQTLFMNKSMSLKKSNISVFSSVKNKSNIVDQMKILVTDRRKDWHNENEKQEMRNFKQGNKFEETICESSCERISLLDDKEFKSCNAICSSTDNAFIIYDYGSVESDMDNQVENIFKVRSKKNILKIQNSCQNIKSFLQLRNQSKKNEVELVSETNVDNFYKNALKVNKNRQTLMKVCLNDNLFEHCVDATTQVSSEIPAVPQSPDNNQMNSTFNSFNATIKQNILEFKDPCENTKNSLQLHNQSKNNNNELLSETNVDNFKTNELKVIKNKQTATKVCLNDNLFEHCVDATTQVSSEIPAIPQSSDNNNMNSTNNSFSAPDKQNILEIQNPCENTKNCLQLQNQSKKNEDELVLETNVDNFKTNALKVNKNKQTATKVSLNDNLFEHCVDATTQVSSEIPAIPQSSDNNNMNSTNNSFSAPDKKNILEIQNPCENTKNCLQLQNQSKKNEDELVLETNVDNFKTNALKVNKSKQTATKVSLNDNLFEHCVDATTQVSSEIIVVPQSIDNKMNSTINSFNAPDKKNSMEIQNHCENTKNCLQLQNQTKKNDNELVSDTMVDNSNLKALNVSKSCQTLVNKDSKTPKNDNLVKNCVDAFTQIASKNSPIVFQDKAIGDEDEHIFDMPSTINIVKIQNSSQNVKSNLGFNTSNHSDKEETESLLDTNVGNLCVNAIKVGKSSSQVCIKNISKNNLTLVHNTVNVTTQVSSEHTVAACNTINNKVVKNTCSSSSLKNIQQNTQDVKSTLLLDNQNVDNETDLFSEISVDSCKTKKMSKVDGISQTMQLVENTSNITTQVVSETTDVARTPNCNCTNTELVEEVDNIFNSKENVSNTHKSRKSTIQHHDKFNENTKNILSESRVETMKITEDRCNETTTDSCKYQDNGPAVNNSTNNIVDVSNKTVSWPMLLKPDLTETVPFRKSESHTDNLSNNVTEEVNIVDSQWPVCASYISFTHRSKKCKRSKNSCEKITNTNNKGTKQTANQQLHWPKGFRKKTHCMDTSGPIREKCMNFLKPTDSDKPLPYSYQLGLSNIVIERIRSDYKTFPDELHDLIQNTISSQYFVPKRTNGMHLKTVISALTSHDFVNSVTNNMLFSIKNKTIESFFGKCEILNKQSLQAVENYFRLFDINGYPLTDFSGNVLKNPYGHSVININLLGSSSNIIVYDSALTPSTSIEFNPYLKPITNLIIKLMVGDSPLLLFDKYSRPLTDSSGRTLVNNEGCTLLQFNSNGYPVSDCKGRELYTTNGILWSKVEADEFVVHKKGEMVKESDKTINNSCVTLDQFNNNYHLNCGQKKGDSHCKKSDLFMFSKGDCNFFNKKTDRKADVNDTGERFRLTADRSSTCAKVMSKTSVDWIKAKIQEPLPIVDDFDLGSRQEVQSISLSQNVKEQESSSTKVNQENIFNIDINSNSTLFQAKDNPSLTQNNSDKLKLKDDTVTRVVESILSMDWKSRNSKINTSIISMTEDDGKLGLSKTLHYIPEKKKNSKTDNSTEIRYENCNFSDKTFNGLNICRSNTTTEAIQNCLGNDYCSKLSSNFLLFNDNSDNSECVIFSKDNLKNDCMGTSSKNEVKTNSFLEETKNECEKEYKGESLPKIVSSFRTSHKFYDPLGKIECNQVGSKIEKETRATKSDLLQATTGSHSNSQKVCDQSIDCLNKEFNKTKINNYFEQNYLNLKQFSQNFGSSNDKNVYLVFSKDNINNKNVPQISSHELQKYNLHETSNSKCIMGYVKKNDNFPEYENDPKSTSPRLKSKRTIEVKHSRTKVTQKSHRYHKNYDKSSKVKHLSNNRNEEKSTIFMSYFHAPVQFLLNKFDSTFLSNDKDVRVKKKMNRVDRKHSVHNNSYKRRSKHQREHKPSSVVEILGSKHRKKSHHRDRAKHSPNTSLENNRRDFREHHDNKHKSINHRNETETYSDNKVSNPILHTFNGACYSTNEYICVKHSKLSGTSRNTLFDEPNIPHLLNKYTRSSIPTTKLNPPRPSPRSSIKGLNIPTQLKGQLSSFNTTLGDNNCIRNSVNSLHETFFDIEHEKFH